MNETHMGRHKFQRKGKKYSFESFLNKKVRDKIIKKEGHLIENLLFTIGELVFQSSTYNYGFC